RSAQAPVRSAATATATAAGPGAPGTTGSGAPQGPAPSAAAPLPGPPTAAGATTAQGEASPPSTGDAGEPVPPVQVGGAESGGPAAARWRADAWSAAAVAATALGKDLAGMALSATPAGPVDGPASAALAGGFVAAMLGDPIDAAAAVTGAIQPDGAIGPAAGLPEQFAAAIERGKTRIGYPAGMRLARSAATGVDVDLAQLARGRGAEAIELADARDAYRLLTGHRLPAPVPVAAAAMALEPAALARLDARYLTWQRKLADEWAPLLQLEQSGRLAAPVAMLVRIAHHRSERAEALYRAGKLVAAYGDIVAAWLHAASANRTASVIGAVAAGDAEAARAALTALDPGDAGLRATFERIAAVVPTTLPGQLTMLEALQAALRGWANRALGADALRAAIQLLGDAAGRPAGGLGSPATAEAVAAAVAPAVVRLLRATAEAAVAEQELAIAAEPGGAACTPAPADLTRAAAALQGVAAAALGHADALVVEPLARRGGIAVDAARDRAAMRDPDYLIADQLARAAAVGLPRELAAAWGDDALATGLLGLAAARAAYHGAALVIARHEVLGARGDDAGRIDAVARPQALRALLAAADRAARAAARTAEVATGAIPIQARRAYQIAAGAAAGGVGDQLDALAELWTATAFSEAAVILARTCRRDPVTPAAGRGAATPRRSPGTPAARARTS
ncbi:MAG TPA: hypothetical protein VK601_08185, partial [Kofleriaceae bacterium]|nr:hypothetical protein [Kofleriaceae bacterium]